MLIKGNMDNYKFGSFVHLGKIWWCPRFDIRFSFDVDDDFELFIDREQQIFSCDRVRISMDSFFGIAPTLYSFLNGVGQDTLMKVFGICEKITVTEIDLP